MNPNAGSARASDVVDPARLVAFHTLTAVEEDEAYANLVLPHLVSDAGLSGRDAALATELGYGTLRATGTIDEVLRICSTRPLRDIEIGVLNVLRLGAYQLLKTRIPSHAAVATSVDLARATGNTRAAGFVNAVLRKVSARSFDDWCERIARDASPLGRIAIRYSHPGWIVGAFAAALSAGDGTVSGPSPLDSTELDSTELDITEIEAALAADDERPETHLVAWPGRISRAELVVESAGQPGPFSPYAVRLVDGGEPGALSAVRDRRAGVQDEGSQLCALALAGIGVEGPDERWLDLCAGPGGKAALLAALADDRGARLTANELHPHRAELISRATAGWDVEVTVGDARRLEATPTYDRVLLDAPCTGLGALRRRPEARWRKSPDDQAGLVRLQGELLDAAVRLVRPGGVVGYVTCSPHLAETREQIAALLQRRPDLELLDARPSFVGVSGLDDSPMVQLWPHRQGTDAMFFAALRRTG
ncbi:RsmB/NOP family class I SAM-dependent RNA methyltransferase [Jatrophihabitans sp. DSM 45814]